MRLYSPRYDYRAIQADVRNRLAKETRKHKRKQKRKRNLQMNNNIILYAVCHFCFQKQEVSMNCKSYSCIFCHQPNNNPFYTDERNDTMDQPRDKKGRFIKVAGNLTADPKEIAKKPVTTEAEEKIRPPRKAFWEVDEVAKDDCVSECSKVQKEVEILVEPKVKKKVNYLMEQFKHLEWLAYLLGSKVTENNGEISFLVDDIVIPKQKVSGGLVWDVECENYNKLPIIGVMHSHHSMTANFSHQDHDTVNQNHDVSLLISHNQTIGQVRVPTPCGGYKIIDNVKIKHMPNNEMDPEFIKEVNENISTGSTGSLVQVDAKKSPNQPRQASKPNLNDSQKRYCNGSSVKSTQEINDKAKQYWEVAGYVTCDECQGLNDIDNLRCEFCQSELPNV